MDYEEPYRILSSAVAFAKISLEKQDPGAAFQILTEAQADAEWSVISQPGGEGRAKEGHSPRP